MMLTVECLRGYDGEHEGTATRRHGDTKATALRLRAAKPNSSCYASLFRSGCSWLPPCEVLGGSLIVNHQLVPDGFVLWFELKLCAGAGYRNLDRFSSIAALVERE